MTELKRILCMIGFHDWEIIGERIHYFPLSQYVDKITNGFCKRCNKTLYKHVLEKPKSKIEML